MSSSPAPELHSRVTPLRWEGDLWTGHLEMLDQRSLPHQTSWLPYREAADVAQGIRHMVVRGAPAIGIAAAFGVALGVRSLFSAMMPITPEDISQLFTMLGSTRPTAVNLAWALERMRPELEARLSQVPAKADVEAVFALAHRIWEEDAQANLQMAVHGASLFSRPVSMLTHCNTGALATGGYGTALGIVRMLDAQGRLHRLYIDETRPYLQGSRLTAWECVEDRLPGVLITDSMAGYMMQQGQVDAVIVGADRITARGDVANKIGTYSLAVLCRHHQIPFYVAAPSSTFDLAMTHGREIPIEHRGADEIKRIQEVSVAPESIDAMHPAFDVTPGELITAIVTEHGVCFPPYDHSIANLLGAHASEQE